MKESPLKPWLAVLAMITFMVCLYLLFFKTIPAGSKDVLLIVAGALIVLVKDVYGYYFGSSEGSARKTELLSTAEPATAGGANADTPA